VSSPNDGLIICACGRPRHPDADPILSVGADKEIIFRSCYFCALVYDARRVDQARRDELRARSSDSELDDTKH
jgi:hypothetical protein